MAGLETVAALGIGAGLVYFMSKKASAAAPAAPTIKPSGFSSYSPGAYSGVAAQTGKPLPTVEEFTRDEQAAATILKLPPGAWYSANGYWWRQGEGKPYTEAEYVAEQRKVNPNYGKYQDTITGAWVTGQEPERVVGKSEYRDGTVILTWEDRVSKQQRREIIFDPKVFEKYQGKPYDPSRPIKVQVASAGDMSLENPKAKADGSFAASAVTPQGSVTVPVDRPISVKDPNPVKTDPPKKESPKTIVTPEPPKPIMVMPVPGVEKPVTPGKALPPILPSPLPPPTVPTPVTRPGKFTPV